MDAVDLLIKSERSPLLDYRDKFHSARVPFLQNGKQRKRVPIHTKGIGKVGTMPVNYGYDQR